VLPAKPGLGFELKEGFLDQYRVPYDPKQWDVQ